MIESRPPGRPTSLTPEVRRDILKAIESGAYAVTAAQYAGIGKSTFFSWMVRGSRGEEPYSELLDAVTKAKAKVKATMTQVILKAAIGDKEKGLPPDWRAALAFLERTAPDEFGKRLRIVTDDEMERAGEAAKDADVERVDLGQLTAEELRTLQKLRAKARVARVISGVGKAMDDE